MPKPRVFVTKNDTSIVVESDCTGDLTHIFTRHADRITGISLADMEEDDHCLTLHTVSRDIDLTFKSKTNARHAYQQLAEALQHVQKP